MTEYTVVLFQEGQEVGIASTSLEVLEDTETQIVVTATFDVPEAQDILDAATLAEDFLGLGLARANDTPAKGVGTAEGHVVNR